MDRSYWTDLLLLVVTLGFYMPYWMWRRNRDLQDAFPELDLSENAVFLVIGSIIGFVGNYFAGVAYWTEDLMMAYLGHLLVISAVLTFSYGVYVLVRNGEEAAGEVDDEWRLGAPLIAGGFALTFLLVAAGNIVDSVLLRSLALLLVFAQPLLWYPVYEDLESVEARGLLRGREGAPPAGGAEATS